MFWETLPGVIASWAAAVAGLLYLAKKLWKALLRSRRGLQRFLTAVIKLLEIGDKQEWPNGAESLPHAMREIYKRQGQTHALIKTHLEEAKQQYAHHLEEWHGWREGEEE